MRILTVILFLLSSHAFAEKLFDLVSDGYGFLHKASFITFDGCDYDKPYKVGRYYFVCKEYGYTYNYGDVVILSHKEYSYKSHYMCVDAEHCYKGELIEPY